MADVRIVNNKILKGLEINGKRINVSDMTKVVDYYNTHCTAEVIYENFTISEEDAIKFAKEVRFQMDKAEDYSSDFEWEMIEKLMSTNQINHDKEITASAEGLFIDGYEGMWYVIGTEVIDGKELFLLESENYGDETFGLIIDKDRNVLVDESWNGFLDYHEKYDN